MDVLHLTSEQNLESIFKYGILRSKPLLKRYNRVMKDCYGSEYDEERGLVFCFPEEINRRDKYIIDFAYWKCWGDIRNRFLDPVDYETFWRYEDIGPKVFYKLKPKLDKIRVLLLEIEYEDFFSYYKHCQYPEMGNLWKDMDIRYEHCNKPLVLLNYDVKPEKIKKVIGSAESFLERGKINITLNI